MKNKLTYFLKNFYIRIYTKTKLQKASYIGKSVHAVPKLSLKNVKYMSFGDRCYFGPNCRIEAWDKYNDVSYNPKIVFGKDVRINSTCHIGCINYIEIGDQCLFGSHVMIIDHSHGKNDVNELAIHPSLRNLYSKGDIVLGKRCWIGENAVILPGVHVGDETIIGANAVVTKSIPKRCVVAGNPARIVRKI